MALLGERVVKDAYGKVLADGDIVALIKDLKLKGLFGSAESRHDIENHSPRRR